MLSVRIHVDWLCAAAAGPSLQSTKQVTQPLWLPSGIMLTGSVLLQQGPSLQSTTQVKQPLRLPSGIVLTGSVLLQQGQSQPSTKPARQP